jgi:methyl-accepting chemotaxis protein
MDLEILELQGHADQLADIGLVFDDEHAFSTAVMEARQTAQASSALAHDGDRTVGQMVDQMKAIDVASRRITGIIGVIAAIAFQTDMLALNAAVEAVGRGNVLAAQARATMDQLTGSVSRVDEVFHSLSADTNGHAAGVEAIRDTTNELNQQTQRNLEVAAQAEPIAGDLADRAAGVTSVMACFKLGAPKTAVPRPLPPRRRRARPPPQPRRPRSQAEAAGNGRVLRTVAALGQVRARRTAPRPR